MKIADQELTSSTASHRTLDFVLLAFALHNGLGCSEAVVHFRARCRFPLVIRPGPLASWGADWRTRARLANSAMHALSEGFMPFGRAVFRRTGEILRVRIPRGRIPSCVEARHASNRLSREGHG